MQIFYNTLVCCLSLRHWWMKSIKLRMIIDQSGWQAIFVSSKKCFSSRWIQCTWAYRKLDLMDYFLFDRKETRVCTYQCEPWVKEWQRFCWEILKMADYCTNQIRQERLHTCLTPTTRKVYLPKSLAQVSFFGYRFFQDCSSLISGMSDLLFIHIHTDMCEHTVMELPWSVIIVTKVLLR